MKSKVYLAFIPKGNGYHTQVCASATSPQRARRKVAKRWGVPEKKVHVVGHSFDRCPVKERS